LYLIHFKSDFNWEKNNLSCTSLQNISQKSLQTSFDNEYKNVLYQDINNTNDGIKNYNNIDLNEIENSEIEEIKSIDKLNDKIDISFNNYELEDSKISIIKDADLGSIRSIASSIKSRLLNNSKFLKIKSFYNSLSALFKSKTGIEFFCIKKLYEVSKFNSACYLD